MKMKNKQMRKDFMNPYLAGMLLGVTLPASFIILGVGLGASGGIARFAASLEGTLAESHTLSSEYFGRWGSSPMSYYLVFMLSVESFRGIVRGVPSMLLPPEMLALHLSQMGIHPQDRVVIVPGDKIQDATLVGMAFQRLGHQNYAVLNGGFGKWASENRTVDAALPPIVESRYPVVDGVDDFTVDYLRVHDFVKNGGAVILDVRPVDYYAGKKSDEARAGHIPGAINRPFSEDVLKTDKYSRLKSREELATVYAALIPSRDSTVIVHCRTGHQASQTYFVLKHLLGYPNVLWYDAGWTEWAARPKLPVDTGSGDAK